MPELHDLLERRASRYEPPSDLFDRVLDRRRRRDRNRRIRAGVVALVVAAAGIGVLVLPFSSGPTPAGDSRSPFLGGWVTTDGDGGTPTMTIGASGDGAVEIVVHDDLASVCSGAPSTMTGTGRLDGAGDLVIPSPVLTCDDGSEPEALSGPPLQEQLRNLTFVHDPQTDALTDNFESVWRREGDTTAGMWPQSSLEELREAQRLADAGDDRFTWQVEPELDAHLDDAEIFARFLREELGWEAFLWNPHGPGGESIDVPGDRSIRGIVFIRCAPGRTNPLYPNDPRAGGCAPTIDELRYETVQIDVAQLGRRGSSGIWVVTSWHTLPAFQQVRPPSDAEATGLLRGFLGARVDGEGAEEYVNDLSEGVEIPLLYATTAGARYERFEIERHDGPTWPYGEIEFTVRLFAEGGTTVVEQFFTLNRDAGRLGLDYYDSLPDIAPTTENGQALAKPYRFLRGEVTFDAPWPWDYSFAGWHFSPTMTTLFLDGNHEEHLRVLADPRPIETGCREGPAPADAEALARSIRSDPDLEATEPVAVSVGGVQALRMDVVAARGATVCDEDLTPVMTQTGVDLGHRMRLYLLDLPGSARVLAIAIVSPEPRFEQVVEAAAPIVDSFEFRTG